MTVTKPYTFSPGPAVSAEVNANFDELYDALNNDYIDKTAALAFTNIPSGPATNPTTDNQFTRKAYVDSGPAQGVLGYVSRTTDAGPDPFADAAPGTSIAGLSKAVTIPAGRLVRLKVVCRGMVGTVNEDVFALRIVEGTTVLAETLNYVPTTLNGVGVDNPEVIIAPSAGAHTYFVTAKRLAGSGNATFYGDATYPFQLVIEDVGPA